MYDLKIINGKIADFKENTFQEGDIGIIKGKIVAIGKLKEEGKEIINAQHNIVSPGFIDIHIHEEKLEYGSEDGYDIGNKMCLMGVTTAHGGNCGINLQEPKIFAEYVKNNGAPVNYLMSVGYNYLREQAGITNHYEGATEEATRKIIDMINEYVDLGFVGVSFGIEYSPGITFNEMLEACKGIKNKKVLLSAHYRSDGEAAIEAVEELINLSRITTHPMEISHLGSCSAMGRMKESLKVIEKAIAEGVDVMVDCYPYDAFSTFIGSAVFDEGCFERWNKSYDSILLTEGKYKGLRCDELLFNKVKNENPETIAVAFVMNEEEVIECIKAPFVLVGSDGLFSNSQGHPRGAGTFPRVLGKYVGEKKIMGLIEGIKKMTCMPAKRLGLRGKGSIEVGMDADIVIFNEEKIIDKATFENPALPPEGIDYVIVNGVVASKNGELINKRAGRFIRAQWGA